MHRRDFGSVRQLPSRRWQARYFDRAGRQHAQTFNTKTDATRWLAAARADLDRGDWFDPTAGAITLRLFFDAFLRTRRVRGRPLAPRTVEVYRWQFSKHIDPVLGAVELRHLDRRMVRDWHARLTSSEGPGASTAAKCYRLLRAMCNAAVSQGEIARSPCAIPGAGQEDAPERPTASVAQVLALADAMDDRWRALVLLAAFCGLRFGELAALTRKDIDPLHGVVVVRASVSELRKGVRHLGPPKTEAGRRKVAIPEAISDDVLRHLATYVGTEADAPLFLGPAGGALRSANFGKNVWRPALLALGMSGFHFHDLRHTGNTLAAATGASLADLMARMGHSSSGAALRYLHATPEGDQRIATGLSAMVTSVKARREIDRSHQGPRCSDDHSSPSAPSEAVAVSEHLVLG